MKRFIIIQILDEFSRDNAFSFSTDYLNKLSFEELKKILDSVRYLNNHGDKI